VLGVDRDLKDAAVGMGMMPRQVLFKVEVPVALPLILLGLRTATIQVVATATIAAYISLGGFGRYIMDGLATDNYQLVAAGAACVVVLALLVQFAYTGLARLIVPAGLRKQARQS
jgi:osmoprotectant transport system permease protein